MKTKKNRKLKFFHRIKAPRNVTWLATSMLLGCPMKNWKYKNFIALNNEFKLPVTCIFFSKYFSIAWDALFHLALGELFQVIYLNF